MFYIATFFKEKIENGFARLGDKFPSMYVSKIKAGAQTHIGPE